jgi:iron(III) transport system permease protein
VPTSTDSLPVQATGLANASKPIRALQWIACCALLCAAALPLFALVAATLARDGSTAGGVWLHYASTVLPGYLWNSLILGVSVAAIASAIGVACAWQIERYEFPGRRILAWALLLPMAMPAYVAAYALTDYFQFSGPLQSALREVFSWKKGDYWFPEPASMQGAIAIFSLTLYPYVYLLSRNAFSERGTELFEAARTLGLSSAQAWRRAVVPVARPAVAAGALLIVMETLADFGTVSYFGVETFTTGIYRAWQNMGDLAAAAQLALALLFVVLLLIQWEKRSRARARYASSRTRRSHRVTTITSVQAWVRTLLCGLPLLLGFIVPCMLLLRLVLAEVGTSELNANISKVGVWAFNSLRVGVVAALVAVGISMFLNAQARLSKNPFALTVERVLSFGYAVPGAVLALGVLLPLAWIDNQLISASKAWFGVNPGLLLTGSVIALVYASVLRFYGVASANVSASYSRIALSLDDSARVLGMQRFSIFKRVHWPLLRRGALAALLLVFIDSVKELPATLSLRPFNFDTLATMTYTLVKDERLAEAAWPSLAIVAISLPAIWLLARTEVDR